MSERPVLVIGATGRTGRLIVGRLLERSVPVRALVRDADKAREVLPDAVPQFTGDVRRSETLAEALSGAGVAIVATCGGPERGNDPETVDYYGACHLMPQAAAAGVDLVVFISTIYTTRPEHYQDMEPTSLGWKARAEEVVRGSGVPYVIVRSGWLTDGEGGEPLAVSQGDDVEGRIAREDLARVCADLLSLPNATGKTFELVAASGGEAASLVSAVSALTSDEEAGSPVATPPTPS